MDPIVRLHHSTAACARAVKVRCVFWAVIQAVSVVVEPECTGSTGLILSWCSVVLRGDQSLGAPGIYWPLSQVTGAPW